MALLEALLLMAAAPTAAPPPSKTEVPPTELLEFLGEWSEEDAKLIDAEQTPAQKVAAAGKRTGKSKGDTDTKAP